VGWCWLMSALGSNPVVFWSSTIFPLRPLILARPYRLHRAHASCARNQPKCCHGKAMD
jgi:hypothetical protein